MENINNKLKYFALDNPLHLLEGYYIRCSNCNKQYFPNNKYDINMRNGKWCRTCTDCRIRMSPKYYKLKKQGINDEYGG